MSTPQVKKAQSKPKTTYELWQDTIDSALSDSTWQEYDCDIQQIVSQFNRHLSGIAGYIQLDWQLIKAMVWTESGGPDSRAWANNIKKRRFKKSSLGGLPFQRPALHGSTMLVILCMQIN